MAYVQIDHLVKRFGPITAVDGITFEVDRGEVLGFLGPNGAGKSTTMKMITGFLTPDDGDVTLGGASILESPIAVKRRLGYLPEGAPLYGDMTCATLLEFIAEVRGLRGADRRRQIEEVIERVDLGAVVQQPIETLSKGYKRRVGLAQAILHNPEVLILDEPTDGLDPNQKHEVRRLIHDMAPEKVIILSTHILEEVDAVCTRAVIIAGGRLVSDGTPAELEARSRTHNSVALTLGGAVEGETVRADLAGLDGVQECQVEETSEDRVKVRIYPSEGRSIAAAVSQTAHDRSWHVEELIVERGRLDEVFRKLTLEASGL